MIFLGNPNVNAIFLAASVPLVLTLAVGFCPGSTVVLVAVIVPNPAAGPCGPVWPVAPVSPWGPCGPIVTAPASNHSNPSSPCIKTYILYGASVPTK